MSRKQVLVVGGGAAGMMAAIAAAKAGHAVTLLEKNSLPGRKLMLTGNGRCNVTNAADIENLLDHVVTNRNFLYHSFYAFSNDDLMHFLEESGLPLKVEDGMRVFPETDRAADVVRILEEQMDQAGVRVRTEAAVKELLLDDDPGKPEPDDPTGSGGSSGSVGQADVAEKTAGTQPDDDPHPPTAVRRRTRRSGTNRAGAGKQTGVRICRGVRLEGGECLTADVTIVATGGLSVPGTGSTGDGFRMAGEAGHRVSPLRPALVPFRIREDWVKSLSGTVWKHIRMTVYEDPHHKFYEEEGDLLLTHFGVSGPMVLRAASLCAREIAGGERTLSIDFLPDWTEEMLEKRLLDLLRKNGKKRLGNALQELVPRSLIPELLKEAGIPGDRRSGEITKEERKHLTGLLKGLKLTICGTQGFSHAMVTQGGVRTDEIDPVTMESRLVRGLRFAGEVLDLDALTGGYNLQIAWSTGWTAGASIPVDTGNQRRSE